MVLMVGSMVVRMALLATSLYSLLTACNAGIKETIMKIKVSESYLDVNFESASKVKEADWTDAADIEAAKKLAGKDLLAVLNLGLRETLRSKLREDARKEFPAVWYSESAYQAVFESFRPKLESRGVEGIKDLRKEFLAAAKTNAKIKAQILAMTELEDVEI